MNTQSFKTRSAKKEEVVRKWYVVDMAGQNVGRTCSKIASVLRGKHKPMYTPHVDTGDFVIVLNSDKVSFSGKKQTDKEYVSFSGYPGGQKRITPQRLIETNKSERIVENAVRGMLPKNRLGRQMFKKLFVYQGSEHPHAAQKPETLEI